MKRLTALMLCIATILSMFAQGFAADGDPSGTDTPSVTDTAKYLTNATDPSTGRPRLYVDFLGDNAGHNNAGTDTPAIGSTVRVEDKDFSLETNGADFAYGWDKYTDAATYWTDANGDGSIDAGEAGTIFYVGVGIDRTNLLKMLEEIEQTGEGGATTTSGNKGVYSFEAGFYYNPQFVEPYVGDYAQADTNANYLKTIENTNLTGGAMTSSGTNARWDSSNYRVLEAYTGLDPQMDGGLNSAGAWGELTQEVLASPSNAQISNAANGWKMTYVSVEMKADRIEEAARLAGYYDGEFHPTSDTDTTKNKGTEYLLVIPFVLKTYDSRNDLCFRLVRNATHFSMGAAPDGAINRAAWERVTTRNEPYNLKLQTMFTGDLNIFTGKKMPELENRYKATLVMDGGGTKQNTAEVAINGDPAVNYARITQDGEELTGLAGGTGMHIETHVAPRYSVTVKAYPAADSTKTNLITFTEVATSKGTGYREFEFIMPEEDVIVEIIFTLDPNAPKDYAVLLDERDRVGTDDLDDGSPVGRPTRDDPDAKYIDGNYTHIKGKVSPVASGEYARPEALHEVDSYSSQYDDGEPPSDDITYKYYPVYDLCGIEATAAEPTWQNPISIHTDLHSDYMAEIRFYTADDVSFAPDGYPAGAQLRTDTLPDGSVEYVLVLQEGGDYRFAMRASDVVVRVDYLLATQHSANMVIRHLDANGELDNITRELERAQLSFVGYRDDNIGEMRYGSVWRDAGVNITTDTSVDPAVTTRTDILPDILAADQTNLLPIPATASTYSGSLAGDRAPESLDNLMRAAALCTKGTVTADDYTPITDNFTTGDLMALGLRKDASGAHYLTDADMTAFATAALELTEFLKADATKYEDFLGTYDRQVPDPANPGTNKTETVTYAKLSANATEAVELLRAWLAASDADKAVFKDRIAKLPGPDPNYTIFKWAHDYLYSEAPFDHDDDRYGEGNPTGTPRIRGIAVTNGWTDVADKQPMQAREGRVMRVTALAGSEYTVQKVVVREKSPASGTTARSFEATKDTRYANVYTFEMPAYDVDVEVYYVLRTAPKLTLVTEPATLPDGAAVRMVAYTPSVPGNIYATEVTKTQNGDVIPNALSGSVVRIFIDKIPDDYSVSVRVTDAAGTTVQTKLLGGGVQIREGSVVTFVMPTTDTTATVTFEKIKEDDHRAYISVVGRPAGLDITGSSGVFQNGYPVITMQAGGELTGTVVVPKGYYIYSVTAIGRSGSYPFEQSGNGWDNDRAASVDVKILSTMPNEDLYITVQLAEGPPPKEPLLPVTLLVNDEGNKGVADTANAGKKIFDDNHAVMTPYDIENPPSPVPPTRDSVVGYDLGEVASTAGILDQDTEYVESGSLIYVDVVCHADYYISATVVTPTRHNIEVEWVSESRFRFATPDSACAVTVTYTKKTESDKGENFHLTVSKTESPSPDTSAANKLTALTIGGAAPTNPATIAYGTTYTTDGRVAVEATIDVDTGWYVRSVRLIQNGSTRYLSLNGNTINFIMPPTDTELIVDYRHGNRDDDAGKFDLRLEVYDPDNVNQAVDPAPPLYDPNSAKATIDHRDGSPDSTLGAFGRCESAMSGVTTVVSGDTVTLEWEVASGYALEAIAITAGGRRISPRYVYTPAAGTDPAKTTASFDMPAADTTVRVRFIKGDEHLYRADIVIYGADGNLDNRASFEDTLGGSVNDDVYNRSGLHGGEYMPVYVVAADGYYIKSVTVRPSSTGIITTLSGSFGPQFVSFNMPAADVQVDVEFAKGWPSGPGDDVAEYGVYLSVIDPMDNAGNRSHKLGESIWVYGGERKRIDSLVDGATEYVHIHRAANARVKNVTVVDSAGHPVPWWWSGRYSSTVSFEMPPLSVDVIVEYELVTDWTQYEHSVTLHTTVRDGASGSTEMMIVEQSPDTTPSALPQKPGTPIVTQNGTITGVLEGELVKFTATPGEGSVVVAAYAVSNGRILDLYSRNAGAAPLIPDGGPATFSMPNANADVYVVFDKATTKPTDRYATLYVSGPYIDSSHTSGDAELFERWDATGNTTGAITPNNHSGSIVLGIGSRARVKFRPHTGYSLASFKILDSAGNRVDYTMVAQADGSLYDASGYMTAEYIQPQSGSRVYVEFEQPDPNRKYTARVVVDNGGSTDNTAAIDQLPRDAWVKLIQDAKPGEQIDINVVCATGYEFSITVLPQHRGIQAPLLLPNNRSQQSAFIMPADDVVVFVKFVTDSRTRYTAALSVSGGSSAVTSTIRSDFNTVPLVAHSGGSAQIVRATPDEEKVYVNTRRAENRALGYSVESIIVETTAGDPVPYTLDATGNLSFPMVASNVNISVKFKSGDPPKYDLTLHVGNDGVANGTASLTEHAAPANTTGLVSGSSVGFNTRTIEVTAGQTVDLSAAAQDIGTYGIYYAYVVYGDSSPYAGQFIPFGKYDRTMAATNASILRSLEADFVMQPYDVDVYLFFADDAVFPPAGTVLWLSVVGPNGSGSATLTTDYCDPPTSASPLTINAGDADAFLPASPRSYASISLNIATGYTVESIVITPLGSDADGRLIGSDLYTLTMPEHTIKVRITLKKSETTDFVATLHVSNIDKDGKTLSSPNRAEIGWPIAKTNWTDSITSTDAILGKTNPHDSSVPIGNDQIIVPERQVVDLYSYVNSTGYYLLSAYVLTADGRMVPLSGDPIDGTAYDPAIANDVANAQTSFEMPANDVDVYVVYTNLPSPPPGWRTTALVATEAAANGDITNGGHNTASITEAAAGSFFYEYVYENNVLVAINTLDPTRLTPHKATVPSFGNSWHKAYAVVEGKGVYVAEETLGEGYAFSPPVTMSASGGVPPAATLISSDPYRYNYTTLDYSSAARMHFIEGNLTAGDLRVEIVDKQNPGNLIVKNRVDVYAPSKPTLGLVSSDSAGAWQIIRSVDPGSQVTALVTPYEGYAATAVLINKDGDKTEVELERRTDGSYLGEFLMPGGGATFRVTFTRGYNAELRVINRSSSSVSATLSSPDGRSVGDRQTINGLLGGEEMTIAASGATVQSVVYSGRTTFGHAISPLESSDWQFNMPAEDTVVTVIFGDDDSTEHTAIIRVDDSSDADWDADCSIDGIRNDTRPGAVGGTNWTTGIQGEAITGMFSTNGGWYASAYAIVRDPDGTLGELVRPVYVAQSGTSGAGLLAGLTMPNANVEIFVRFTKTDPTPHDSYNLSLVIEGAGGLAANSATAVGVGANLSVSGTSTHAGPTSVAAGTLINVGVNRTGDYRLMSAEVEVTYTAPNVESGWNLTHRLTIPMTTTGSSSSGSFRMPFINEAIRGTTGANGLSATVKIKLKLGYDATLVLYDGVGGSSATMTAGGKSVSVSTNGGRDTITGLGRNDATSTTVNTTGAVSAVGYNATDGSIVLTAAAANGPYAYTMNGDSVITVVTSNNTPTDRRYIAAVRMINAGAGDWAYITDTTTAGMPSGDIWTAAKRDDRIRLEVTVGSGRSASVTANGGVVLLPQAIGGDTTYTFDMPANDVQITVEFFDESHPTISFGVIDRTGIAGSTASMSYGSPATTLVSHTSTGSESRIVGSYAGNFGTLTVDATPINANVAVKKIIVEGANGGVLDITTSKTFNQNAFTNGATVWVVFDKPETVTPPPPDYSPYITYIEVDPNSDTGWAAAGNGVGLVLNTTDPTADGGAHWREGAQGDNMRGLFTTAEGWFASVKAYRMNADGSRGSELLAMQQNTSGGGTGSITQPASDAKIVVLFSTDKRIVNNESKLTLAIVGHGGEAGNKAGLTLDGVLRTDSEINGSMQPDGSRYAKPVASAVKAGTAIPLDATWASGYTIAKIEVSLDSNGSVYSVPWNEYASMAAANFYMPNADATITVYYSLEFTATLHIQNSGVVGGGANMYDDAAPGTVVSTHLGKLEGLGGGEDIVTEPSVPSGGRLVGVFYETVKTGSHSTYATTPNARYDFDMPQEDADVYVVYEPEDEPIKSYVARVEKYGETDVAGNEATILNTSRDVFHTTWSTMAKQGDLIQITVNLARGYQARVIGVEPGTLYVTRTAFRTDGTTTTFTMPANSDAVVKIEFIEGYTATLILDDSSTHANSAKMTNDSLPNVSATSVPDGKTYIEADSPAASSAALDITNYEKYVGAGGTTSQVTDPPVNGIEKLGVDDTLDGDVTLSDGSKLYRLIETTPTGGTRNYGEGRLYKDGTGTLPIVGAGTVDWGMSALGSDPVEDVLITAVVLDKDDPSLIAKVQLEGDSDINGNGANIANTLATSTAGVPASAWMSGDVWTSAISSTDTVADTIETTVHLAPGYTATVIAINDEIYYTALATLMAGGTLTRAAMTMDEMIAAAREYARIDVTHLGATALEATVTDDGGVVTADMPKQDAGGGSYTTGSWSDITFIVKFSAESGPRPYDPLSAEYRTGLAAEDEPILEKGWIYGVNHGDYATITVPTLFTGTKSDDDKDVLQDVYRASDAENGVVGFSNDFRIYVQTDAGFIELDNSTEIRLYEVEPRTDTTYPYNTGSYYTGTDEYAVDKQDGSAIAGDNGYVYTGVKFNVELRELAADATPSAAYLAFKEILESDSYDAVIGTKLKIRAVGQNGSISEATQLVIPHAYALAGTLVSYAPQHVSTLELYEYDTAASDYEAKPIATNYLSQDYGTGLWRQDFRVMSSELAGRDRSTVFTDLDLLRGLPGATGFTTPSVGYMTYRLVISKAAALTYTRDGIQLRIENGKAALTATDAGLLDGDYTWVLARSSKPAVSGGGTSGSVLEASADVGAVEPTVDMPDEPEPTVDEDAMPSDGESAGELPTEELSDNLLEAAGEAEVTDEQVESEPSDEPITDDEPLPTDDEPIADEPLPTDDEPIADEPLPTESEPTVDETVGAVPHDDPQVARDMVILMTGDLNGDGKIKQVDYSILYAYYSRQYRWTRANEGEAGWDDSTRNPNSLAYWCDLNGDTRIDTLDLAIITDSYNYNRTTRDYGSPTGLVRAWNDSYDTTLESYINDVQAAMPTALSEFMFDSAVESVSSSLVEDEPSTEDELPAEDEIPVEEESSEGEMPSDEGEPPIETEPSIEPNADEPSEAGGEVELPRVEPSDEFILPPSASTDENEDAELPNRREDDENDENR